MLMEKMGYSNTEPADADDINLIGHKPQRFKPPPHSKFFTYQHHLSWYKIL
jgi:hypothetical protein